MLAMTFDLLIKCLPRNKPGVNCARNDAMKNIAGIRLVVLFFQQAINSPSKLFIFSLRFFVINSLRHKNIYYLL